MIEAVTVSTTSTVEMAGGALRLGLLDQAGRARIDLVVGTLALAGARHRRGGDGKRENNRRKAHQILHIPSGPGLSTAFASARRKSRRCHRAPG